MIRNKKIILLLVFGIIIALTASYYLRSRKSLWTRAPKISLNYDLSGAWWIKGPRPGVRARNNSYQMVTKRLRDDQYSNISQVITDNFCQLYVNPFNNTVFVVVKSLEPEVTDFFLDVMNPPRYVCVIFRKGEATWWELERWEALIGSKLNNLRDLGVRVTTLSKTANATIRITIFDIDLDKVKVVLDVLKGKVPPGILEFYRGAQILLH